ncbi:MAG TPA: hypothetical protein VJ644_00025 [Jiangellaceae bacterium]|nr:hypothetical protein [Jiangellaceae bacterium]
MTEQPNERAAEPSPVPLPRRVRRTRPPLSPHDLLQPVTRRGRLVSAIQAGGLDLQTENGRIELLGPYGLDVREGDEVEIVGVPAPWSRSSHSAPPLLIRQLHRLG